ncbi:MAG TPA: hypothetical protein VFT06_16535 [Flavisolibacter sp.]|jgi:hypothetical protein|nr:hypothetical protein [Flavisolibacter sp.]
MPTYRYDVQGCQLTGDEIRRLTSLPNFGMIVFHMQEEPDPSGGSDGCINVSLSAADSAGNPLPGSNVSATILGRKIVSLKNLFEPRDMKLTKDMIDEVSILKMLFQIPFTIKYMEFRGRPFRYRGKDHPNDYDKDFVGYRVKIKK